MFNIKQRFNAWMARRAELKHFKKCTVVGKRIFAKHQSNPEFIPMLDVIAPIIISDDLDAILRLEKQLDEKWA